MNNKGQSLLEVIVAMAIFALISVAMITLSLSSFTALEQGGDQTEASALAQEGMEAVRAIRDSAWNRLIYNTSSISIDSSGWLFTGEDTVETIGKYTRAINLFNVCRDEENNIVDCPGTYTDVHSKKITSVVAWEVRPGVNNSVRYASYLTNWDTKIWSQTDWAGGSNQTIWSDAIRYRSADNVVDDNAGQVVLDHTSDTSASITWPFDVPDDYNYMATSIEITDDVAQLVGVAFSSGDTTDDGFENTTSTSYTWLFDSSDNYIYDNNEIEVSAGFAQLVLADGFYSSSTPVIYPVVSYLAPGVVSWDSFTETAIKNGGEIYYQLSDDDGITWQYWNGSAWVVAGASNYNTASVVNTNISSFSNFAEQINFKVFLESDGVQQVQLDNISIGLTPHTEVWGFSNWNVDDGEVEPTGSVKTNLGNPDNYAEIIIPSGSNGSIGGYWEQAVTINENNPTIDIDFDYKVIDFNGVPDVAKIRVYLDMVSGDPVNQVGSSISVSTEGDWISADTIDISLNTVTAKTYYLKVAFWVETPEGNNIGPFTIGFDNVNLNWSAANYPTDKPVISNSTSFAVAALDHWNSFVETADKNGGEIYYQLSNDDGNSWKYWNGSSWVIAGDLDYNTASVVNNTIQYFDTSTKKLMFKSFLESDGTQQIKLDNIEVQYDVMPVSYIGNRFFTSYVGGVGLMSGLDDIVSMRFTATTNNIVESLHVYLEQENGDSSIYRYGLQSDISGKPSGTWLGETNKGFGDHTSATIGWQVIDLGENVKLTQDEVYHLVVQHKSGIINENNSIELRGSGPDNYLNVFNGLADVQSSILFSEDSGATWTIQDSQPIFVLGFIDEKYEGNPYHEFGEHKVYGDNSFGQQFIPNEDVVVSKVDVYISKNSDSPVGDIFIGLQDVTSATLLATSSLATSQDLMANIFSWETAVFDQPITLYAGNTYRLFISAPEVDDIDYYLINSVYHENDGVLNNINYQGVSSTYIFSIDGGNTWSDSVLNEDLAGFRFQQTIFDTEGYLISSAFNAGSSSSFNVIEWDQVIPSCSPNCEVKLQIQTAIDEAGSPGAWSATWCGPDGEDGDETDYFTINEGQLINTIHNEDQWIRYKATLVGDSVDTPILEKIIIYYQ